MKKVFAEQVMGARVSDTGEEVHLTLRDETGAETAVVVPADQLGALSAWLDQAASKLLPDPSPSAPVDGQPPIHPVEWWTIRPEPDDEHVILGFRTAKGADLALRLHRNAARQYVQALSSLLGRTLPASPSKARH